MRSVGSAVIVIGALMAASAPGGAAQLAVPNRPETNIVHRVGLFDWLFGGSQQAPTERPPPEQRPSDEGRRPSEPRRSTSGGTYRTLCVRLCDGSYFPISFATTRGKFRDDASRCERQCPTGARLFVHRDPGETVDEMVDLDGAAYTKLPVAFRFRENHDATCHGNPWDAEAMARHQSYAQQPQPPRRSPKPINLHPRHNGVTGRVLGVIALAQL